MIRAVSKKKEAMANKTPVPTVIPQKGTSPYKSLDIAMVMPTKAPANKEISVTPIFLFLDTHPPTPDPIMIARIKTTQFTHTYVCALINREKDIWAKKVLRATAVTTKITALTKSLPQKVRKRPRRMKIIPMYGAAGCKNF